MRIASSFQHAARIGPRSIPAAYRAPERQGEAPGEADQIIWGQVAAADGFRTMAFDILSLRPFEADTNAFFVSVRDVA